jgi:hypothetical protein
VFGEVLALSDVGDPFGWVHRGAGVSGSARSLAN